jgi:chemotaxis methyl-accepting protein methylase
MTTTMRRKYLLRSRDKNNNMARIVPELRQKVRFRRPNFIDGDFGFREQVDVIFCRNVVIYFDRPTQEVLLNKFKASDPRRLSLYGPLRDPQRPCRAVCSGSSDTSVMTQ